MATTGSSPASIATVAHGQAPLASTRRTVVTTATTNIPQSSRIESASELITLAMTSAAMLSCTMARAAATTVERGCGRSPSTYIVTVRPSSRVMARATGQPGSIVTVPPYAVPATVRGGASTHAGYRTGFRRSGRPLADWAAAPHRRTAPATGGVPGPRSDQHAAR